MHISSSFDGGNIRIVERGTTGQFDLQIRNDRNSDFFQWFYFRLTGAMGQTCTLNIVNAGDCAYPEGFEDYQAVGSYDRDHWFRIPSRFNGKTLTITCTPSHDSLYVAYFAPYSMERHADLVAQVTSCEHAHYERLGCSIDGQDLDLIRIGDDDDSRKVCWITARQHPGETMAEWWMEGFLDRLLDEDDPMSRALLQRCVFYVIPNMNPDGSRRGHLRTNAIGTNLNREWLEPSLDNSPEVYLVRKKMQKTGVDFYLDVHGDEALPYNFISGAHGIPSWTAGLEAQLDAFLHALLQASPDFQVDQGYPRNEPGSANLSIAKNYVAETFKCLAMTLEMPFKDNALLPHAEEGWSPDRSQLLGASVLNAINAWLGSIVTPD